MSSKVAPEPDIVVGGPAAASGGQKPLAGVNVIGQQQLVVTEKGDEKKGEQKTAGEEKRKPNLPRFYNAKKRLKDPTTVVIFNIIVSSLVLAQAIVIAFRMNDIQLKTDADGKVHFEQGHYNSTAMDVVEMLIQCFFLVRLIMNIVILGVADWKEDWIVHSIDSFIIVVGIISVVVLEIALSPGEGFNPTDDAYTAVYVFRWIRACRCLVVFYRYFREVRLLINGIIHAFIQMFWVIGIFVAVNIVMSILLCGYIKGKIAQSSVDALTIPVDPNDPSFTREAWLDEYFGQTDRTMLTLFQITTGDGWSDVAGFCRDWIDAPGVVWYFIVYQIITTYGLINLITGVFVEATVAIKEKDIETQLDKKEEDSNETIDTLEKLFDDCDVNDDQTIDRKEFETLITDPHFAGTLVKLGLDVDNAKKMWKILERGGDGKIDLCEFCEGILQVKNGVGPLDLLSLEHVHKGIKRKLFAVEKAQQETLTQIEGELDRILTVWDKRGSVA